MKIEDVKHWGIEDPGWPEKGEKVVIPQGAHIYGTFKGHRKVSKRTQTVTVFAYSQYSGEVTWPGSGGYWHHTIEWVWPEEDEA